MQDEFETFLNNFELILDKIHKNNPFMTVVKMIVKLALYPYIRKEINKV